ncbi:MAG: bifunctional adenosylcobinamide kinase/adenosylcobinamide-phosphate guanylyltransferase [Acidimicrobiales bacterium]
MGRGMIALVLGGTRSGKSEVAESLAAGTGPGVTYVATGSPSDAEMAARIAAHRARRPAGWATLEATTDLPQVLTTLDGPAVVDSLGAWVAAHADLAPDVAGLCRALAGRAADTIVVSEEVGLGVHAPTGAGRRFADALGEINRAVAEIADEVLLVVAGRVLPLARAERPHRRASTD